MFAPYCPAHRSRVLLSLDDIEGLYRTPAGLEAHYRCLCGHRGVWTAPRPTGAGRRWEGAEVGGVA